ncbi:AAA family ATPase [Streptomyces puniciscabiei]
MTVLPRYAPAPLVGRDGILAALDELIRSLWRGMSDFALVTGPVGAGRSAVLAWTVTRARAAGATVGVARCTPEGSRVPHAALTQLTATVWPASRTGAPAAAVDGGPRPMSAVAELSDILLTGTAEKPLVLAVDDFHLADPDSLSHLQNLARQIRSGPVLVLGTSLVPLRCLSSAGAADRALPPDAARTLHLDPLSTSDARTLLERRAGTPVPVSIAVLTEIAAGSPAVLCTVADQIAAIDGPMDTGEVHQLVAAARAAWSHRALNAVRGLPRDAISLLRVLAAADQPPAPRQLAALAGLDITCATEALEILRAAGLVGESGPPRLRHPWFAEDVVTSLTSTERDALRARTAALRDESGVSIGTVAHLLGSVNKLVRPWTASGATAAARPRCVPADVVTAALRHTLREPPSETQRVTLLLRLAAVEALTAPQAADGRLCQVLLRHASPETWPAVLHAADLLLGRGDAETARRVIADVHQRARTALPDERLRPLRALERLAQSEKDGPPLVTPLPVHCDPPGHPAESAVLAWTLATRADQRPLAVHLAHSTLDDPADIPLMCRIAAARVLVCADAADDALASLDAVLADAGRVGAHACVAQALLCRAEAAVRHGRAEDAVQDLTAATQELPRSSWHSLLLPRLTAAEVLAHIRCGHVEEARRLADSVTAAPDGQSAGTGFLLYARAELALIDRDPARALVLLEECRRVLSVHCWRNPMLIPWRSAAATSHQLLGAPATAAELLSEEQRLVKGWGTPRAFAGLWTRTRDALTRLGAAPDRPMSREESTAAQAGSEDQALTAAERDLARFVMAGMANREIADFLGIATRTVELRLTRLYRRLGLSGRAALVARVLIEQEDG